MVCDRYSQIGDKQLIYLDLIYVKSSPSIFYPLHSRARIVRLAIACDKRN